MRNVGLILKTSHALHGFMPEELNKHFSSIAISTPENPAECLTSISAAPLEGFHFTELSEHDVIWHFHISSHRPRGKMGHLKV